MKSEFEKQAVPRFEAYTQLKRDIVDAAREEMRLDEFRPRVLTSFVRNKLLDTVYLPLIGDNLAKQIGTSGEGKLAMLVLTSAQLSILRESPPDDLESLIVIETQDEHALALLRAYVPDATRAKPIRAPLPT